MTMSGNRPTPVGGHLPADTACLFPEYDFEQMDLSRHQGVIIGYYSGRPRCNALQSGNQPSIWQTQPRIRVKQVRCTFG
jgi:hypothetical protein